MNSVWSRFKFVSLYLVVTYIICGLYYISPLSAPYPASGGYGPVPQFGDPIGGFGLLLIIALKYLMYDSIVFNMRTKRPQTLATISFWVFYVVMLAVDTRVLFVGSEPGPVSINGIAMSAGIVISFMVFLVCMLLATITSFIPYRHRKSQSKSLR